MVVIKRRFSHRQKHTFPNGRVWVDSIPGQRFCAISFDSFVLLHWAAIISTTVDSCCWTPSPRHCVGPMIPPGLFSQHVWAAFAQRLGASSEASKAGPSSAGAGWGGVWAEHGRLQVHCWVLRCSFPERLRQPTLDTLPWQLPGWAAGCLLPAPLPPTSPAACSSAAFQSLLSPVLWEAHLSPEQQEYHLSSSGCWLGRRGWRR